MRIYRYSVAVLLLLVCASNHAATIYFDNGASLVVPQGGWEIDVHPKGFNMFTYNAQSNPNGKLPGWGGWPNYKDGCGGELTLGGYCVANPYFETLPEPVGEECTPEGELTLGGNGC